MRKKPTDGYAERIRRALKYGPRPMSVRALAEELGERYPSLRGTSYGGVRLYVEADAEKNPRNPRVELLRAFADVLEVRPEWLAFGQGHMLVGSERTAAAQRHLLGDTLDRIGQVFLESFFGGEVPEGAEAWDTSFPAVLTLWRTRRIHLMHERADDGPLPDDHEIAVQIGGALAASLRELGIPVDGLTEHQVQNYALAMVAALTPIAHITPQRQEDSDGKA